MTSLRRKLILSHRSRLGRLYNWEDSIDGQKVVIKQDLFQVDRLEALILPVSVLRVRERIVEVLVYEVNL